MKRHSLMTLTACTLVLGAARGAERGAERASAEATNAPAAASYDAFRILTERNIFSASRSRRPSRSERSASRPSQVDAFALVGTMSYEKGHFAFFDGSSSDYRRSLKADGTIAGFKVCEIGTHGVRLDREGKQIELRVGSQMRREDGGEWKLSAERELPGSGSSAGGSATTAADGSGKDGGAAPTAGSSSGDSSGSGGGMSEVLKRLMEQREKETK